MFIRGGVSDICYECEVISQVTGVSHRVGAQKPDQRTHKINFSGTAVFTPQAAKATALHRHAAATWQQQEEGEGLVPCTPKKICCLFFILPFRFLK